MLLQRLCVPSFQVIGQNVTKLNPKYLQRVIHEGAYRRILEPTDMTLPTQESRPFGYRR
jgi:hypothetical protein